MYHFYFYYYLVYKAIQVKSFLLGHSYSISTWNGQYFHQAKEEWKCRETEYLA